jgi:uncharacterized protein (TIGR00255 family)
MICGMTAFARRETRGDFGMLACEIRSVNHRYLEAALRLPDALRELEPSLRELLRAAVSRGKVDVWLRHEPPESTATRLEVNHALAARLVEAAAEIDKLARHTAPLNAADILRMPGVLLAPQPDNALLAAEARRLFDETLAEFLAMRRREGEALAALIASRLDTVAAECARAAERLPALTERYRRRLRERLAELRGELSAERLEQEMVIFAQKTDVAEELDRLHAHAREVRRVLAQGGPAGRKLDFLMQELNREANTLGAKSVSADSSLSAVELKVLIEQMREQVQNIE